MTLARNVCQQIPADSVFYDAVYNHLNLFLYGSVAPDTCFHYILGPCRSVINHAGNIFHTTDEMALVPILEFLRRFPEKDKDALAFAAGLCCHIMTDSVFHPMVWYFSGAHGIHQKANVRHRMFETALDLHFQAVVNHSGDMAPFHRVSKKLKIPDKRLAKLLKNLFCLDYPECHPYLRYAFKSHCLANRLFNSHNLFHFMRKLSQFNVLEAYEVLFYPFSTPVRFKFFDAVLDFRHPVSGERFACSLESLAGKTVKSCLDLLSFAEDFLSGAQTVENAISTHKLPKIAPCMPETVQEFSYWHGDTNIRQKIYSDIVI